MLRFTNIEDKNWFEMAINRAVSECVDANVVHAVNGTEPYFVDFMRDPPEPSGEEADDTDIEAPKIYEEVCHVFSYLS